MAHSLTPPKILGEPAFECEDRCKLCGSVLVPDYTELYIADPISLRRARVPTCYICLMDLAEFFNIEATILTKIVLSTLDIERWRHGEDERDQTSNTDILRYLARFKATAKGHDKHK